MGQARKPQRLDRKDENTMPRNTRQQQEPQEQHTTSTPESIVEMAEERGLEVTEMSSFYKIAGNRKAMYVAKTKKSLTRVDLSGFELDHPAVEALNEDDAKDLKLGRVRGQIFPQDTRENWQEAIELGLDVLMDDEVEGSKFQSRRHRGRNRPGRGTSPVGRDAGNGHDRDEQSRSAGRR